MSLTIVSPAQPEEDAPPDTAKIGIYVISLYDIDFPGNKAGLDFYVWYNYFNDSLKLNETFELVNAREYNKIGESSEKHDSLIYSTFRCNAVLKQKWNVKNFPFDRQHIEVFIEDVDNDKTKLVFIPDTSGSRIDKSVQLEGWNIRDFTIRTADNTYETNYGDPTLAQDEYSTYSRVVASFTLEREGNGLFFKVFMGLFISVLISLITFFVNPTDLDPRFGLSVGAIFAAIASQYVISSMLPNNDTLTLVDILHDISFILIFICILISTVSLSLMKNERKKASMKLDRYSFFALSLLYIFLVLYFVIRSI